MQNPWEQYWFIMLSQKTLLLMIMSKDQTMENMENNGNNPF